MSVVLESLSAFISKFWLSYSALAVVVLSLKKQLILSTSLYFLFPPQDDKQKLTDEKRALEMRIGFLETDIKTLKEKQKTTTQHHVSIMCDPGKILPTK